MEPLVLLWFAFFLVMAFVLWRSMGEERKPARCGRSL